MKQRAIEMVAAHRFEPGTWQRRLKSIGRASSRVCLARRWALAVGLVTSAAGSGLAPSAPAKFTSSLAANPSNDFFADAQVVEGSIINFAPVSVEGATMEPGEPLHLGASPQKSVWWKWTAPRYGDLHVVATSVSISEVTLAVYQGSAVDALGLFGKGTNELNFSAVEGETYYLAAAVPADAMGDISCAAQQFGMAYPATLLPGNLLREPSWEGTRLAPQYWGVSGDFGGYVNEGGGCDGSTWPALGTGTRIWQDFPTIPGHTYAIQFADLVGRDLSGCCGLAGVRTLWDDRELGIAYIREDSPVFWHWEVYTAVASNTTSRITFENIHRVLEMDAFSVVDLSAPPTIVAQPASVSSLVGGTVAFSVGAKGAAPLAYQWFFNQQPLAGRTAPILVLDSVTAANAGSYFAIVTNTLGSATSHVASLVLDFPTNVTILVQPYGDVVPVGGYFNLSVVAAGAMTLSYQWFLNKQALADATNHNLTLSQVQLTNAGTYEVLVQSIDSSVWSLPANLTVTTNENGGGQIDFRNRFPTSSSATNYAPVFNIDGFTPLSGDGYVAQLYAGPSVETIRPVGEPTPFTGPGAGLFAPQILTLPNVPPGGTALAQVRAWERARGTSYEEARALGGRFGRSTLLEITAGGGDALPSPLDGLTSFSLQTGLPTFNVGLIKFVERQPHDIIVWALQGEAGFRYLVEKSVSSAAVWRPYVVLTNVTGTVTFTDSADTAARAVLYRARILD